MLILSSSVPNVCPAEVFMFHSGAKAIKLITFNKEKQSESQFSNFAQRQFLNDEHFQLLLSKTVT